MHRMLVVDDEPEVRRLLGDALDDQPVVVYEAGNLQEAGDILDHESIELIVVDVSLPDGNGLEWAESVRTDHPDIQTIVITGQPSLRRAVRALRAGASDFLSKPLDLTELNQRVSSALHCRKHSAGQQRRIDHLTHLVKELNQAHDEISKQVDILCHDLVTAYQDLAGQMNHVETVADFRSLIQHELDLEALLRSVLEYLLQKVGPTDAVIFLPSHEDGYTVGGYINATLDSQSADVLLSHLADIVAPRVADSRATIALKSNEDIKEWIGDDSMWLVDAHIIAAPCVSDDEVLAVLMLFRDQSQPFDPAFVDAMNHLCTTLGEHLNRIVRVHDRNPFGNTNGHDDDDEGDGYLSFG
ncbi:MAG: hypothetical protein CMJ49_03930 [Planctomycetaceae bacterium]|nr:hypothetical protein [Planctomycetaceae bacterium]